MKPLGPIPAGFAADADGMLLIGSQRADRLIEEAGGTPLFAYDRDAVTERVKTFRYAMPSGVQLHYAMKANPYEPLLHHIRQHVDGFDIASNGEMDRVDRDWFPMPISFAGPGKSDLELEDAMAYGITLNVESEREAERALNLAAGGPFRPKLAIRVNPPFGLKGSGQKMGGLPSQFGVDHDRVPALIRRILEAGADWQGLHIFAGSQALQADAVIELQRETVALAALIAEEAGHAPSHVNLGGGFGIPYFAKDQPLDI